MNNKYKKIKKNTVNYFVINGQNHLYIKDQVSVNFKPYNKTKQRKNTSIVPAFNNDRRYYTTSFVIPSSTPENIVEQQQNHNKRVAEALLQIQDIMMPKPRSKHKYCGVCRGHYQQYKDHIQSIQHLNFLNKSVYQKMIVDLCQKVQKEIGLGWIKQQQNKVEEMNSQQNVLKMSTCSSETSPTKVIQN